MMVEYHLFRVKPLEKCLSERESLYKADLICEAMHVIDGLRSRIINEQKKVHVPVQGYAFVDRVPALLIRADGSLYLFERYSGDHNRVLHALVNGPSHTGAINVTPDIQRIGLSV